MPWICSNVTATEGNPLSILPENLLSKINIIDPQAKKKRKKKRKEKTPLMYKQQYNSRHFGLFICIEKI